MVVWRLEKKEKKKKRSAYLACKAKRVMVKRERERETRKSFTRLWEGNVMFETVVWAEISWR